MADIVEGEPAQGAGPKPPQDEAACQAGPLRRVRLPRRPRRRRHGLYHRLHAREAAAAALAPACIHIKVLACSACAPARRVFALPCVKPRFNPRLSCALEPMARRAASTSVVADLAGSRFVSRFGSRFGYRFSERVPRPRKEAAPEATEAALELQLQQEELHEHLPQATARTHGSNVKLSGVRAKCWLCFHLTAPTLLSQHFRV